MIQKTNTTNTLHYWIHTNDTGFTYFHSLLELSDFVMNNDLEWNVVTGRVAYGAKSLDHKKTILAQDFMGRDVESFTMVDYVLSHDVSDILRAASRKKRISRLFVGSKKHSKGYSFRKMNTLQEKRMYYSSLIDVVSLKEDYGVVLNNTRNGNGLCTSWDDIYRQSQNNWKTTTKIRKQWMKHQL